MVLHQLIKLNSHPEGTIRAEKLFKVTSSVFVTFLILSGLGATGRVNTQSDHDGFPACAVVPSPARHPSHGL